MEALTGLLPPAGGAPLAAVLHAIDLAALLGFTAHLPVNRKKIPELPLPKLNIEFSKFK